MQLRFFRILPRVIAGSFAVLGLYAQALEPLPEKFHALKEELIKNRSENPCDKFVKHVERKGDRTLSMKAFLCTESDFDKFKKIASETDQYPNWAMERINVKSRGGSYLVQFKELKAEGPGAIKLSYLVDIPVFRRERTKTFKMHSQSYKDGFVLSAEGIEAPDSLLEYCLAELVAIVSPSNPKQVIIAVEGKTKLKSALLYAALPEKALQSEGGDRVIQILENYQTRESASEMLGKTK